MRKGHIWECAVGDCAWFQMPTCPDCEPNNSLPAVAHRGIWEDFNIEETKCSLDDVRL